jgi:hypothetical protein
MPIRSAVLADRDTDLSGFVIPSARERLRKPLVSSRADWVDGGTEAAALLKLHRTLSAAARILGIACRPSDTQGQPNDRLAERNICSCPQNSN